MSKQPTKQIVQMAIAGKAMLPGNAEPAKLVKDPDKIGFPGEDMGDGPTTLAIVEDDVARIVCLHDVKAIFLAPEDRTRFDTEKWELKYWQFPGQEGFGTGLTKGIVFVEAGTPVTSVYRRFDTAGELASGANHDDRAVRIKECCYDP